MFTSQLLTTDMTCKNKTKKRVTLQQRHEGLSRYCIIAENELPAGGPVGEEAVLRDPYSGSRGKRKGETTRETARATGIEPGNRPTKQHVTCNNSNIKKRVMSYNHIVVH